MKKYFFPVLIAALLFSSCDKETDTNPPQPGDQQSIRLKDYTIPNLPSPWYHLEYDNAGFITKASHSSGQWDYAVSHRDGRIAYMLNVSPANKDSIAYNYVNGRIDVIRVFDMTGEQYRRCFVDYDNKGRLASLEWERKSNPGFIAERTLTFAYYPDNNLRQRTDRRFAIPNQQSAAELIDTYSDYDNKQNPDGYTLTHEAHGQLVLLPSVKLQYNNARKVDRTGTGEDYRVVFSYLYNGQNLPTERNGVMTYLTGPETGNSFNLKAFYTYY